MICLERDGEELLGFGRRNMDELEEGEACSYHTNNNNNGLDDARVDPDIDLSYIDEKLQDVLGHFQKDFEGGVSAENLGAKFGGYGSFLPIPSTRSPVWPRPRTPPKNHQNHVPKSPNTLQLEGVRRSSIFSSNTFQSLRPGSASANVATAPASKASTSLSDSAKKEVCMPSTDFAEEFPPKLESVKKRNAPDPKMLKVRIKMGSDNLSMQNNAAIYSGLGLVVSPSSSLDDSPSESEDLSHEPQGILFESPAQIIQIMTSFPVHGGVLLSPLSDDLLHLIGMEKLPKDGASLPVPREGLQGSGILVNGSDSVKTDRKISGAKFTKLPERNEISTNLKSENVKDSIELEGLTTEELVSDTLKLPIVSKSDPANGDVGKGMSRDFIISKEVNKGAMKNTALPDLTKEKQLVRNLKQEDWLNDNPKSSINGKLWEDKKSSSVDSTSLHSRKDGRHKGEKHDDYVKVDSSSSTGKRGLNSELTNLSKEKANPKTASYEQESMKLPSGKDSSSSEGKKKTKGSQGKAKFSMDNVPKESSRAGGSSSTSKSKKSTYEDNHTTEGEPGDSKSQKQTGKSRDRYRDFFGDIELERENRMSPSEMSSEEERAKVPDVAEKITHTSSSVAKEKSSGKKPDKQLMSEPHPKAASSVPPPTANGPILDTAPAAVAPVVFQENWVCCDKCQTWRLLPLGKNPQDLPEKWLCSMLNWLPGMNKCSFTEEETTNALRALYQVPGPVGQSNLHSNIDGNGIASTAFADARLPDQNQHSVASHAMPVGGKKKQGSKDFSNIHYKDGNTQFWNSTKKMTETPVSINDAKRSIIGDEPDYVKLSKSTDVVVEKSKHKKEKLKGLDNHFAEGDMKRSKAKSKRDYHQENSRSSKKIRNDTLTDNWMPDHGGPTEKAGPSLNNGQLTMSSSKNLPNYNDHFYLKDSKPDLKDWVQVSAKKPNDRAEVSLHGSVDLGKQNNGNASKKRKSKEIHNGQPLQGSLLNSDNHVLDRILGKEDFNYNDYRKEKKARISRLDGKESSSSKGSGRTDKKCGRKRSQPLGQDVGSTMSQRSLESVDPLKRDSGMLHSSAAATSSSSKVSGSRKSKTSFHEAKGSPVESVSSSPMRVLKPEKVPSARRNLTEKDDFPEAGLLPLVEDDGGINRSGSTRKDKTLDAGNHGSLESTVLDFQEKESDYASGDKAKMQIVSSPDLTNPPFTNGNADYLGTNSRYSGKSTTFDRCHDDERHNNHHHVNASSSKKLGKGSSSCSKDKLKSLYSESESGVVKISDSTNEQASGGESKLGDDKSRIDDKIGGKSGKDENMNVTKMDLERPFLNDNRNGESNSNAGDAKVDTVCVQDPTLAKQTLSPHGVMTSKREKSHMAVPSRGAQNDTVGHRPQPAYESCKENETNSLPVSASHGSNTSKVLKRNREAEHQNGIRPSSMRNPSSSSHRVKDVDGQSPVKRDSVSQAANNAIKEAKNLKHMADRQKSSGLTESSRLYLEAILKFLNAASLLESNGNENGRTGDMMMSVQIYSTTAKLCEFCAHECEKSKDMATAALAYKCMEVAYMRVIFSSHSGAFRDRNELQKALQMNPPGESPSSSASDVDNLNHLTTADKVTLAKGISSPQVAGNHIIAAQNRPNFIRLLNYTQDVNSAMEASRKSIIALSAANLSLGDDNCRETIKRALDFNFQDVEGLLRLVRLAIEAISSQK